MMTKSQGEEINTHQPSTEHHGGGTRSEPDTSSAGKKRQAAVGVEIGQHPAEELETN